MLLASDRECLLLELAFVWHPDRVITCEYLYVYLFWMFLQRPWQVVFFSQRVNTDLNSPASKSRRISFSSASSLTLLMVHLLRYCFIAFLLGIMVFNTSSSISGCSQQIYVVAGRWFLDNLKLLTDAYHRWRPIHYCLQLHIRWIYCRHGPQRRITKRL